MAEGNTVIAARAGARAWLITDGKAGSESQATGIAKSLGLDFVVKRVDPQGLFKLIAPFGPVEPRARFGMPGSEFAPPWPDIAISIGRRTVPYVRALRRSAPNCFTVHLLDPKAGTGFADLIWVPVHDRLRGSNVITTLSSPHGFSPDRLSVLRQQMPESIANLPSPRIAVLLGGRNSVFRFTADDHHRLGAVLASLARAGAGLMITTSRRTHGELIEAVDRATSRAARIFHRGEGANPYADFLAHADAVIVTADSVSMTGEASATGVPVHVFHPSRGSRKFDRFHGALQAAGVTRPIEGDELSLVPWSYRAIDATGDIAEAVDMAWQQFRQRGNDGSGKGE